MSGILTSIMDAFRAPAPAAAPAPQVSPTATGQTPTPVDTNAAAAAVAGQVPAPNPTGATGVPGEGANLERFKDMFAAPSAEQLAAQGKFDPSTLFAGMDATKVTEAVGKMNFTSGITSEQLQAIQAGGEQAMQTLGQLLNSTAQSTMSQAMLANAEMIKQAMGQIGGTLDNRINAVSRQQQIRSTIHDGNPLLSNPAVQPMVDALSHAWATKNPTATPQQVKDAVLDYITHTFSAVNPQAAGQGKQPEIPREYDFSNFLNGN